MKLDYTIISVFVLGLIVVTATFGEPVVREKPGPDDGTVEGALELARQTLEFVERRAQRPKMADELKALAQKVELTNRDQDADTETLYAEIRALRRRIIFSHPLLDFDKLLINKRPPPSFNHQTDQYLGRYNGVGPGLTILDSWRDNPRATHILEGKLPPGTTLHPDLSFDGKRVLFSFSSHAEKNPNLRRFLIYEASIDGTGLRQLTGTASDSMEGAEGRQTVFIEDNDPCYLPEGGFVFVSTRNQGGVRCHHGDRHCPTYMLYRAEADGSNIRQLAYGEANEWDPSLMHDGRIIWTRWDYINRHDTVYQSLWTIRPDGTGTSHFYGNYTRNPCSIAEARAIPGSHKIVGTTTAHHHYTCGSIIVIDPLKGQDGEAPIERITPEVNFPETEGYPATAYATPFPLSEDLFLVAYSPKYKATANSYGIYLIDTLGGRELIYQDPNMSSLCPLPIMPREKPPVLAPVVDEPGPDKTGTFYVQDVYRSTQPIPRGDIKSMRVIRMHPQTTQAVPPRSHVLFETAKEILGTVPVAEDGSVAFKAPAEQPLMFQLLDKNEMSVMAMRTFVYLQHGETVGCVGCHEPRSDSPRPSLMPAGMPIHEIRPSVGPHYEGGLSYLKTVQPVLDRHCIGCHGLEKVEGHLNLLGTMAKGVPKVDVLHGNTSYASLIARKGLVKQAIRNKETPFSKPKDYYSHAGRLAKLLLDGDRNHEKLDRKSFRRVVDWLDLNAQFYGDYSWNKPEWRLPDSEGEKALREHVRAVFGHELAEQPFAALVNIGLIAESRVLMAPLATRAGGWGQIVKNGWSGTSDPGYRKMLGLVEGAITPHKTHDIAGTCGQTPCRCNACWTRPARERHKKQAAFTATDLGK